MQAELNPGRIFQMMLAYQLSDAFKAAIELDLFTAIGEGNSVVPHIAARIGASERGTRILLDYFGAHGILHKAGDEYSLAPDAATFLNRHSPAYMGGMSGFLHAPQMRQQFATLAAAVRKGGVAATEQGSTADEYEGWVDFATSMAAMMTPAAHQIAELVASTPGPLRVLDVAASHGRFGFTIAHRNKEAHITALDWPNVLAVTTANAHANDLADRFSTIAGDAFKVPLGGPYDVILLTNLLHHFDKQTIHALLVRIKSALAPGGKVVTLEMVPNEDRVTPPESATFSLVMLASTPAGDAYTASEYTKMFSAAGLPQNQFIPVPGTPETIVLSHE